MSQTPASSGEWLGALRVYLGMSACANLVWEALQLPLYTPWTTETAPKIAFAVVHCTAGDVMIASLSLLAALTLFGRSGWPANGAGPVFALTLAAGAAYTVYSEWWNTSVRGNWTYSELMPIVPLIHTGLSPLLQWIVVPSLAMWAATAHSAPPSRA